MWNCHGGCRQRERKPSMGEHDQVYMEGIMTHINEVVTYMEDEEMMAQME